MRSGCELSGADAAVLWTATPGGMLFASVAIGLDIAGTGLPPGTARGPGTRSTAATRLPHPRRGLGLPEWGAAAFQPLAVADRSWAC